jgi:hypothetical protein
LDDIGAAVHATQDSAGKTKWKEGAVLSITNRGYLSASSTSLPDEALVDVLQVLTEMFAS